VYHKNIVLRNFYKRRNDSNQLFQLPHYKLRYLQQKLRKTLIIRYLLKNCNSYFRGTAVVVIVW
jgi:hypothetical protein